MTVLSGVAQENSRGYGGRLTRAGFDGGEARGPSRSRSPRACAARAGPGYAAAQTAANSSAGRCQPSVLRGRSLISAAILTTSSTVWTLRSVPFGK